MNYTLTSIQKNIIESINNGQNVLITGGAGTGKSFLLQELKLNHLEGLPITASTGIAAVNVGGSTLHSFAGLGLAVEPAEAIAKRIIKSKNNKYRDRIKKIQHLAIDEVSMISRELFDKLDKIFKIIRKNDYPFGGVQMILFGDFLQLPPINRDGKEIEFLFESQAFKNGYFNTHILDRVFRQKDDDFISLLNNLRFGQLSDSDLGTLGGRSNTRADESDGIRATKIVTHNYQADLINDKELGKIKSKLYSYPRKEKGEAYALNNLRKNCLAPEELELKVGAQVMMLRNTHQEEGIVNGSLGVVQDFDEDNFPIVIFNNGKVKSIEYDSWVFEEYDPEIGESVDKARIQQVPLRLAYAITVHKSQGMTLDKIECDLGEVFAEGQIYVALSRVKTIEGLYLKRFNANGIKVNNKVIQFYTGFTE